MCEITSFHVFHHVLVVNMLHSSNVVHLVPNSIGWRFSRTDHVYGVQIAELEDEVVLLKKQLEFLQQDLIQHDDLWSYFATVIWEEMYLRSHECLPKIRYEFMAWPVQ